MDFEVVGAVLEHGLKGGEPEKGAEQGGEPHQGGGVAAHAEGYADEPGGPQANGGGEALYLIA